jgi:hypothetical protein
MLESAGHAFSLKCVPLIIIGLFCMSPLSGLPHQHELAPSGQWRSSNPKAFPRLYIQVDSFPILAIHPDSLHAQQLEFGGAAELDNDSARSGCRS